MRGKGEIQMRLDRFAVLIGLSMVALVWPLRANDKNNAANSILNQLTTKNEQMVSTIPTSGLGAGDVNPYGVAFVPQGFFPGGELKPGDILVSNFNDAANVQGTGTTIVRITPQGQQSVFFQGPSGLGLTTALGVLRSGFVLVGNLPTSNNGGTIDPTSLLVIDSRGNLVSTLSDPTLLDGPWDLTVVDEFFVAEVFVSNVLNGTVTRLDVFVNPFDGKAKVLSKTQIAHGYSFRPDPNALVVGPTGLAYDPQRDLMYVASTGDNEIFAIPHPIFTKQDVNQGALIYQDPTHLHGPLGLVLAPNGNLITANGDAQNPGPSGTQNLLVEFTRDGKFVSQFQLDSGNPGGAFGLAVRSGNGNNIIFAAVDDDTNALDIWTVHN